MKKLHCPNPSCFDDACNGECMRVNRTASIVLLCTAVVWLSVGCANLKEVDFSITGFEAEWYEPPPLPDHTVILTNAPAGSWIPKLMQRGE